MIKLDDLKGTFTTKACFGKACIKGAEEGHITYYLMVNIDTNNNIEYYIESSALDEVIFESKTYDECVDHLEEIINKLVDSGKYKFEYCVKNI